MFAYALYAHTWIEHRKQGQNWLQKIIYYCLHNVTNTYVYYTFIYM